jgi:hypothetical protein
LERHINREKFFSDEKTTGGSSFKADHDIGKDGVEPNVDVVATAPYQTVFTKINTAKKVKWGIDGEGKKTDYPETIES